MEIEANSNKKVSTLQNQFNSEECTEDPNVIIFSEEKAEQEVNESLFWIKIIVLLFILICLALTIIFFDQLKAEFLILIKFIKAHIILGILSLITIKVVGTVLYVPGIILAIGVGFAYGQIFNSILISLPLGVATIFTGSMIGCTCAFYLGRYVLKGFLYPRLHNLTFFKVLNKSFHSHGKKVNFLLRLTPLIPYNIANYFLGVTETRYIDYLVGLTGFLPLLTLYVFIGTTLNDLSNIKKGQEKYQYLTISVTILFSLISIIIIAIIAKKQLYRQLEEEKTEANSLK